MLTSFTPDDDWFVFAADTGKTIRRGFRSRVSAEAWIGRELRKIAGATDPAA